MKKFKKFTSLIGLILTVSILLCFFASCDLVIEPMEDEETKLQKKYCTATLDDNFCDDEVLVYLFPEYKDVEYTVEDFADIGCIYLEAWTSDDDPIKELDLILDKNSKENVLETIKKLEKREDVYYAKPEYVYYIDALPDDYDPYSSRQWAISRLKLTDAWDITTGSNTIYVGVIDTGIDITHPDLANVVDTTLSKSYVLWKSALDDANGHGTHVAGIIGAQWNNEEEKGIGGVCWDIRLVSLRVANNRGEAKSSKLIKAINYAQENGIQILNISMGGEGADSDLKKAIEAYTGVIVCAAGNENSDNDQSPCYPANYSYDNLITVGASNFYDGVWINSTQEEDGIDEGSNYGATSVDLFAPGGDIYSTYPLDLEYKNGRFSLSGTSMAAPFVTGVAALMLAEKPTLTPAQIKSALISSVDQMSAFSGKCVSGGRLNAYKALKAIHTDHSYDFSCSTSTSSYHSLYCRCGDSIGEEHTLTYSYTGNSSGTHSVSCYCGYTATEAHTYKITSSTVRCTQCSYSHSHSHAISYTSISPQAHKVTCACGVVAYESHDGTDGSGGVLRCSKCGYGIELWSIDPPVTSQKYTLNEYR